MKCFDKLVSGNKGAWTTLWAAAFRSNTALKVAGVSALLLLIVLLPCRASLLAYEGFSYPTGTNLLSLNGGTGWNGGWVDVGGAGGVTVHAGNLTGGVNAPGGYDARSTGNSAFVANGNSYGRMLDCSIRGPFGTHGMIDANGFIGANNTTLYISFLQQPSIVNNHFYEFQFHRDNLNDPGRVAGVGNDLIGGANVNFRVEAPAGGNSTFFQVGPGDPGVNFYVVRIDYLNGNDNVYVYRNPASNTEPGTPTLAVIGAGDMSFNGISIAAYLNGCTLAQDEIRMGLTWADVIGGPPVFTVQPTNENLYVGQTAVFTAMAQSSQPVSYQWFRGGSLLPEITNASLTLPNLQLSDANVYSVVASNALGVVTSSAVTLTVQPIGISIPVQTLTLETGSNLVLAASVGGSQPVSLQWFKDGIALAGATNATFAISNTTGLDAGQYILVATNAYGSITSSVVSVCADLGGILAYEGFDYPPAANEGNLSDQNGGIGWTGAWTNPRGYSGSISAGSMLAGSNGPSGYDRHSSGSSVFQPAASQSGRWLDCSAAGNFAAHGYIDANGNIGADGKTLYVSFLQQPNGTSSFYEFEFHRGALGDSGRAAGIGNDTGDSDVHLRAEVPAGGNSTFWDLGPGNTNVNFYVMRIDYKPGNDDVFVYRNPTSLTEPVSPVLTVSNVADLSFDSICLGTYLNNRTAAFDEIRFGMTWADVIGNSVSMLQLKQRLNGNSTLRVAGSPSNAFVLQGAGQVTGTWTNIGIMTVPTTGAGDFVESNVLAGQRFYRAVSSPTLSGTASKDTMIADFEGATYGPGWVSTGTAFGAGPAAGALPNEGPVSGFEGLGLCNSSFGADLSTGTLTSPPFTVTAKYLDFLVGGGQYPGQECMNLLVNGTVACTATGSNSDTLSPIQWDVSPYLGQSAVLQLVDSVTGSWGHILIDQIVMTDLPLPAPPVLTRQILVTSNLLNLPVKNGATMRRFSIVVGGKTVQDFDIELAEGVPDWWAAVDLSPYQGQTATLTVNGLSPASTGLSSVVQTNGIVGATNLYQESLRPQLHYSCRRGIFNDVNGLVYYQGKYNLYYQHNPYGVSFGYADGAQRNWGHAVSTDLIHWQELPDAIYPHSYGDYVWSGSAAIDWANGGGFKTGTNDVIVASYNSTARSECIAFSNDGGLTFTDSPSNPAVVNNGRDPHILWFAPSNYWVMAVYDGAGGDGIAFYSSPNLHQWTYRSKIMGFYECPDLFQMPVDDNTNNPEWVLSDGSSGYMLGQFNGAVFTPTTTKLPGNSGSGFYAAQSFTEMPSGDNRRIRIGWAQISMPGMPYNQMLFFPTELKLKTLPGGVRLCATPIAEITNAVANTYSWTNLTLNPGSNPLMGIRGQLFDIRAQFTPGSAQTITFNLCGVPVTYNPSAQQITCNGNTRTLTPVNGTVTLELITDRQSVEIYGNSGQLYMPVGSTSYSPTNNLLSLTTQGASTAFNSLVVSKLKTIWPNGGN
jgi:fructan beta-fructosidase